MTFEIFNSPSGTYIYNLLLARTNSDSLHMFQMSKSNKTHVTLTDVGYELDGNVSCEVAPDTRSGKPSKLRSHTVTLQVICELTLSENFLIIRTKFILIHLPKKIFIYPYNSIKAISL